MDKKQAEQLDSALFKKLEELTIKIPSDPTLYTDQVLKYSQMFKRQFDSFLNDIQKKNQRLAELLIFLARIVHRFTKHLSYVPVQVIDLLKNHGPNLHPYIRKKCVGAIMILRAKNILFPVETTKFLLSLFNIEDKQLRKVLYKYILNDIRRMNKHHQNNKINQEIKNHIFDHVKKHGDKMTQKSLQLMIQLYRRNIWTDTRSVNIIAEGCFNQSSKVRLIAAHFLIATTEPLEELSESEDELNPSQIKFKKGIIKHTKNKEKQVEKQKKKAARKLRKKQIQGRKLNFMPIDLIYNPQDFAEKLFNIMAKKNTKFSHKIIFMSLISRLIWRHQLIILPFYGSLVKYLQPKQKEVPKVLTYFAESVHQLVPDDQIQTIIKHIIQKFVNDRCSEFAMTIGLNTIRQVYNKLSYLMNEDTIQYLSGYYDYKNKNVSMAAKALINMIRDINPQLLPKKYRGKKQLQDNTNTQKTNAVIDGADLLDHKGDIPIYMDRILTDEDFKKIRKLKRKQQEEEEWKQFQVLEQHDENEGESEEESEESEEASDEENEEFDWEELEEIQVEEGDQEEEQQEDQQEEEYQQEDQQESQLQLSEIDDDDMIEVSQDEEQVKPKKKSKKQKMEEKRKQKMEIDSDDDEDDWEQQDPNPHGFLSVDQIAFYKKSKGQLKAQKKQQKQPKFKHKPKQKKGGTTNKQKQKLKPLMMLRAKKNKIRTQEKQVKMTIKNLKNKLGKVRSGKEAKKLKNKKIKKVKK